MDDRAVQAPALPKIELMGPDVDEASPRRTGKELAVEIAASLPNLARLLYRLVRDPRVPRRSKLLVAGAAAYLVSPVDLIPELLFPVVGRVDDLIVLAFAFQRLISSVDPDLVRELWDGDDDALELISSLINWAAGLMPAPLRRMLPR